jgi:RNA recognition motif-containing protein
MEMEEQTSSTLFVADLPYNVQESEFVRLFEPLDGFISARLRQDKNERLVGFVEFDSHLTAARARDRLQGSKFGLDDPGISIQFSHGKRSGKRPGSQSEEGFASPRRNLGSNQQDFQFYNFSPFAASPLATGQYVPPNNPSYNQPPWPPASSSSQYLPQVPTDASSTLYVEGVPLDASEREVARKFFPSICFPV